MAAIATLNYKPSIKLSKFDSFKLSMPFYDINY